MNMNKDLFSEIWMQIHRGNVQGKEPSLKVFTSLVLETQPKIQYEEYCELLREFIKRMPAQRGYLIFPQEFAWFINEFSKQIKPEHVYVPYATGFECDLFNVDSDVRYCFYNEDIKESISLVRNINAVKGEKQDNRYDLIVSSLPFDFFHKNSIGCEIVENSIKALSDNGYCVFTFSKSITSARAARWLSEMEQKGIFCNAIIDMPIGAYAPFSMTEGKIVIFSRSKSESVFTGLVEEENLVETIVYNFINKKPYANSPKMGVYVKNDVKCYSDYIRTERIHKKTKSLLKAYNGEALTISQIAEVRAPKNNKEFEKSENAIYVPKLGNSPVVMDTSDFQLKTQNYFQVVVNPEVVLPRFLAFFLNTEEGLSLRKLSYKGDLIKAYNKELIENMIIPCPPLELQSEYLKTNDELDILSLQVETIRNRFIKTPVSYKNIRNEIKDINNNGDKFVQWVESLPYPIATILKRYSVADDATNKQEMLFYFFEAYAIFEATILSAVLNKKILDCSSLTAVDPMMFEKASFGNWVRMDRAISNLFLGFVNSNDEEKKRVALSCFKTDDETLVKFFCNKRVCNILEDVSKNRNLWRGHAGITSEALYKEHVDVLDSQLHKLRGNIKDLYERVRLIRPISLSYTDGIFYNKVEILTGSNSIFPKETIESLLPLDNSKLYLQMIDTEEIIELPPYFILKNSPAEAKNACYFYSRVEGGSTRYISYHYDGKPEDMESGEVAFNHIKQLLTN